MEMNTDENTSSGITDLISSYAILSSLAAWISTRDLHNLGLTSRSAYTYIHSSKKIFKVLSRQCLCDGRGLAKRQAYAGPYRNTQRPGRRDINAHLIGDEEIEVRLYNVKCDEAGALPCLKCEVNICEECRCYPRAAPANAYPNRRPHLRGSYQLENIICLCDGCDLKTEKEIAGKFLNERCDCDTYTRWICIDCEGEERKTAHQYFDEHTEMEWDWVITDNIDFGDDVEPSKTLHDHAFERAFWCTCGKLVPYSEWDRERQEIGSKHPFFDDDPNYPRWVSDSNHNYPHPYPRLGYQRVGDAFDVHAGDQY
ncbi:hypothetical protein FHETE_5839 [Fusarium heterosporum]|uniref:Uncharacterized protein n=1 Tax=Fusarium heterosporum TaxID=42747 RepID=A0A8H5T9L0_FUSHE|nr:hypothetical protein FHETE_5839 [Fusarium heterosporum]